jgi:hypothetical protein
LGEFNSFGADHAIEGNEEIAAGKKASGAAWQYCRNSRRLIPTDLRFFERRLSENPRIYRAGAKSSIAVQVRQVCQKFEPAN